ncbi:MAG: hypothetical protein LH479_07170 [Polaromonas sp.]|nr:hypothetical protein [Polaromonas sp.]
MWTSVGSSNFHSRSFSVNDESNLNLPAAPFAQAQRATFDADLRLSRRVTLAEWEGRSWSDKLLDALDALDAPDALAETLSSQLRGLHSGRGGRKGLPTYPCAVDRPDIVEPRAGTALELPG